MKMVSFSYFYGERKNAVSKVYDIRYFNCPSGIRKYFKVWNADRKTYEWIKADACKEV